MLDRYAQDLLRTPLDHAARALVRAGVQANGITLTGFGIGLIAAILIATHAYLAGATAIFISRLCDGLDGSVARQTAPTDAGAFLDIALDFVFYASIPLAFAVADPGANALAAAVLLCAFVATGSSFLALAALAERRGLKSTHSPAKSIYFVGGLTEATETLLCFGAMCVWPQHFANLALGFAALCAITWIARLVWGWRVLR
jgi:phosphatidylglycerophosphate synthase